MRTQHLAIVPALWLGACAAPQPTWTTLTERSVAMPRARAGDAQKPAEGDRRLAVGVGVTDSPDSFLVTGDADFYQSDRLAIGPTLLLGFDDTTGIMAPSFHAKFVFPLERKPENPLFMPFVQGGAGFCWLQKDRPGDDDDFGLLLQAGGGLEVRFDDRYALTSTLTINMLPGELVDEGAFLSWQIVQFSFPF